MFIFPCLSLLFSFLCFLLFHPVQFLHQIPWGTGVSDGGKLPCVFWTLGTEPESSVKASSAHTTEPYLQHPILPPPSFGGVGVVSLSLHTDFHSGFTSSGSQQELIRVPLTPLASICCCFLHDTTPTRDVTENQVVWFTFS